MLSEVATLKIVLYQNKMLSRQQRHLRRTNHKDDREDQFRSSKALKKAINRFFIAFQASLKLSFCRTSISLNDAGSQNTKAHPFRPLSSSPETHKTPSISLLARANPQKKIFNQFIISSDDFIPTPSSMNRHFSTYGLPALATITLFVKPIVLHWCYGISSGTSAYISSNIGTVLAHALAQIWARGLAH